MSKRRSSAKSRAPKVRDDVAFDDAALLDSRPVAVLVHHPAQPVLRHRRPPTAALALGGSTGGFPAFTRLITSRVFSRASSIFSSSVVPSAFQVCLPWVLTITVKLIGPVGGTRRNSERCSGSVTM